MKGLKIKIKSKTWNKDSYGLFDYENEELNKQTFTIEESGKLFRENDNIKFMSQKNDVFNNLNDSSGTNNSNNDENYLFSILYKESN